MPIIIGSIILNEKGKKKGHKMGKNLAYEALEILKEDLEQEKFGRYLDTWDYEDDYSHNDIEDARKNFIELANNYFEENNLPYVAKEVVQNVYIFDKKTGRRLYE